MLTQSTQKKLVLYLVAMLFLHVFLAWHSWRAIRIGMPDFSIFYTAGQILHAGRGYELYDDTVQETVQRSFAPIGLQKRGAFIPFNHPPFEALLFVPSARLPYLGAYFLWLAINLGLTFTMLVFLRRNLVVLGRAPFYLWILAAFGYFPLFLALLEGQDSILVLFCYTMAFVGFRRGTELREGAWVGLGLCKFHLVLPFVFPLLLLRRKKFLAGFLLVAVILALLGLAAVGWRGSLHYPAYVLAGEKNQSYAWKVAVGPAANLRGIVESLCPAAEPRIRSGLILLVCSMLLASLTYAVHRAFLVSAVYPELGFSLSLIAAVLLSYHTYGYDLSILFLGALIVLDVLLSSQMFRGWSKRALYGCIGVLFCSPVYMLLTVRYKHSELIGGMLLLFFVVLLVEFLRMQPGPGARPAPVLANQESR